MAEVRIIAASVYFNFKIIVKAAVIIAAVMAVLQRLIFIIDLTAAFYFYILTAVFFNARVVAIFKITILFIDNRW